MPIFLSPENKYNRLQQLRQNLKLGKIDMIIFNTALEILFSSKEELETICKESVGQ